MASIRIPSNAVEILPFCHRSEDVRDDACFETYAHMIVIAACLGYRLEDGPPARECQSILKNPSPIDLAIFRSQRLFSQLLILSMMCHSGNESALDEANLAKTIESLAETGLEEMSEAIATHGHASLPEILAGWIAAPPTIQPSDTLRRLLRP